MAGSLSPCGSGKTSSLTKCAWASIGTRGMKGTFPKIISPFGSISATKSRRRISRVSRNSKALRRSVSLSSTLLAASSTRIAPTCCMSALETCKYMNANAVAVATEIVRAKPSARRNARALKTSSVHIQFEADSADIDDEASRARRVELAPQIADLHVDDIRLRHKVEIPNILEQHRPGHDLAWPAHEIFEQREFPRQQINRLAVAPH